MKPLRLEITNVGRFPHAELDFQDGCVALVGPNGAGKSTLLGSIEAALFADGTRDLAPMLGPHGDRMEIVLTFEHAGEVYRVRRGYNGKRATLDLEREGPGWHAEPDKYGEPVQVQSPPVWEPLTRETTAATQQHLEDILGLSRATFNASAFLAQGNAAAFPQAKPADRKALIGEILDPRRVWPGLRDRAAAEARELDRDLAVLGGQIGQLQARVDRRPDVEARVVALEEGTAAARAAVAVADRALEDAQARQAANAAAAERVRTLTVERERAQAEHARVAEDLVVARDAKTALPGWQEYADGLRATTARVPELEDAARAYAEAQALESAAEHVAHRLAEATRLASVSAVKIDSFEADGDAHERCSLCEQSLNAEARAATLANLRRDHKRLCADVEDLTAYAASALLAVPSPMPPEPDAEELAAARKAAAALPAADHRAATLAEQAARLPALEQQEAAARARLADAQDTLADASEGVTDENALGFDVLQARTTRDHARQHADTVAAALARAQHDHEQLQRDEQELAAHVEEAAGKHDRLDLLRLAEQAYGRDGVPALIVENAAVPQIEAEANRILDMLPTADGTTFRVELRTQKALKSDNGQLRETLDIVVSDTDGDRAYETYSGGERARLNIALRVALARLLAGRRGADSRLLALDELEYLDEQGQEALVAVLRDVAAGFDRVLVVSHAPGVRDAFDATVEVVKVGGVSRIREAA